MTILQQRAMARLPLTVAQVEDYYRTACQAWASSWPYTTLSGAACALCESHERLRAQLIEAEAEITRLRAALADAPAGRNCYECHGTGYIGDRQCTECHGTGVVNMGSEDAPADY